MHGFFFTYQTATPPVNGHRAHPQGMLPCTLQCSSMEKMLCLASLVWKWPCLEELLSGSTMMVHEQDSIGYACLEKWGFFSKTEQSSPRAAAFRCRFCKFSFISISKRNLKKMSTRYLKIWLFSAFFLDLKTTPETLLIFLIFTFKCPGFQIYSAQLHFFPSLRKPRRQTPQLHLLFCWDTENLLSKKKHSPLPPSTERVKAPGLPAPRPDEGEALRVSYSSSQLPLQGAWAPPTALLLPAALLGKKKPFLALGPQCTQESQHREHPSTAPASRSEALTKHKQLRNSGFRELPRPAQFAWLTFHN